GCRQQHGEAVSCARATGTARGFDHWPVSGIRCRRLRDETDIQGLRESIPDETVITILTGQYRNTIPAAAYRSTLMSLAATQRRASCHRGCRGRPSRPAAAGDPAHL